MGWFNGIVLYVLIWWTVLFAVLPLGTKPVESADSTTGWRGAPEQPHIGRKILLTTLASLAIWAVLAAIIASNWLSFRHGILGMPQTYS